MKFLRDKLRTQKPVIIFKNWPDKPISPKSNFYFVLYHVIPMFLLCALFVCLCWIGNYIMNLPIESFIIIKENLCEY
jgi:hypothetical protein